jgi:hypothetical protein
MARFSRALLPVRTASSGRVPNRSPTLTIFEPDATGDQIIDCYVRQRTVGFVMEDDA